MNGPSTALVYQFLKSSAGGLLGDLIKWNFEKFLVDKNGNVVQRYVPTTSPFQIEVRSCLELFHLSFCLIAHQVLDTVAVSRGCRELVPLFLTYECVAHVFVVYPGACRAPLNSLSHSISFLICLLVIPIMCLHYGILLVLCNHVS